MNLPVYWIADANNNKTLDPDEVAPLLFYPTSRHVGRQRHVHAGIRGRVRRRSSPPSKAPPPTRHADGKRRSSCGRISMRAAPTLVRTDFTALSRRRQGVRQAHAGGRRRRSTTSTSAERRDRARGQVPRRPREPELVPPQPRPEVRRPGRPRRTRRARRFPARRSTVVDIYPAELAGEATTFCKDLRRARTPRRCSGTSTSCAATATSSKRRAVHRGLQGADDRDRERARRRGADG